MRLWPTLAMPIVLLAALVAPATGAGVTAATPRIADRDRVRLAEAFHLASTLGDKVWPGWSTAPFAVLLVTPDVEFLVGHPSPTPDFSVGPYDSLLRSKVYWRKRVFPVTFQATFPAVAGVSTVVIGQAESAQPRQNSIRWVLTVLHEHFHQWQESRPGYAMAVDSLGLARGDSTGMWMLNFPFPYSDSLVARAFEGLSGDRVAALRARGTPSFQTMYAAYFLARREFAGMLAPDDGRYLAFQLWKEGVARYTEYVMARRAARDYRPSSRFTRLDDYTSFASERDNVLSQIETELETLKLAQWRRVVVYPSGAADALLLDEVRPGWRSAYTRERFTLDGLFPPPRPGGAPLQGKN